ncbi:MAG TPA: glycosyltransferase [Burkholderiaceae bacterium]|jgi:GT2 family glycosyltransferase|nr:glycosyltransferase [Burkholderiaceae bacterium]
MLTVSVVSHGQGQLLRPLLDQLDIQAASIPMRVVLTENLGPAILPDFAPQHFELKVLRNPAPKGFGANHNAAFDYCIGDHFAVLNPDVRLERDSMRHLVDQVCQRPGVAGPRVVTTNGSVEDSARRLPSVRRLVRRVIMNERLPDYDVKNTVQSVDWLAGMCMVFDRRSFAIVEGFDERYHLYCEDVDICLRLHLAGLNVTWVQSAIVEHSARRDSHRNLRYLLWHVRSVLRLLVSPAYRRYRALHLK